jgi:hypothetical protein
MGFNLFGEPTKEDIRVGYISIDRGYVEGVTVCEANRIAELNPGTTFILQNRKSVRYLNINEINKLTPNDAFVPAEPANKCKGIDLEKPYGPPKVEFFGGGGVGVKGNAVVGKGGGILGVHIVSGGHGYKYPPIVKIKDGGGQRGGGAVAVAGLGQTSIVKEVYDAEEEFEEYFPPDIKNLCDGIENRKGVGYGQRHSPDGKNLGPWDPSMYVNDEEDPIKRQIALFQEYLAALTDPWWFVRKEAPLSVVSDNEEGFVKRQKKLNFNPNRIVYPVQHWHWGGSQLKHGTVGDKSGSFEDVVFDIYTEGGKGKGLQFTFAEIGGNHTFTVKADDYTDGGEPRSITKHIKPNVDYKVTSQGSYKNKGTEQGLLLKNFGSKGKEKGLGTSSIIFADLAKSSNDNDDLQIQAKTGRFKSTNVKQVSGHSTYDLTYKLTVPGTQGRVSSSQKGKANDIARSFMNDHAISPVPMSNAPGSDFAGMLFTMEWEEEFPYAGEYTFKAQCDNVASFYLDGQQVMPKIAYYKDKPTIVKKNLDWQDSDKKGKVHKMRIDLLNSLQYKDVTIQEPPQKDSVDVEYEEVSTATAKFEGSGISDLTLVVSGAGTAECTLLLDTNDKWSTSGLSVREMRCGDIILTRTKGRRRETLTGTAKFPAGRYPIQIIGQSGGAGARVVSSTVSGHDSASLFKREGISAKGIADTRIELDDDIQGGFDRNASINLRVNSVTPEKRRLKAPAKPKTSPAAGIKVQKVFNTVDWMGKANRQLWRTNVYGRGGFVNTAGVCPFDTTKELDTNPYAGTHEIKWRNINFPIDGNYIIKVAVDDSVNLRFHGPGGDVSIRKEGFINGQASLPTGTSTYTRFFKKGNYTLDAGLEQIPGGRFGFRQDGSKTVKDKEVSFKVTSAAEFANKITIPGLFSVGKELKGPQLNQNFVKNVEVGKEYDVICTSEQSSNVRVRVRDNGRRLEMEEWRDGDWQDIVCTVTEGQFYSVKGNQCKFKLEETIKGINPMVLAVDVEVAYATKTVVSAKSWNENPMGVAFTIKAPPPPPPIEEVPKAKGRCPNNPMWTTRFPTSGGARSGASGGASSFDGGLRSNIKEWYKQRWNRVASEKEVNDWIGTGKSSSAIRKGILGHQADIAGVVDDGSGSGSGGSKAVSGGQWYPVRFKGWSKFFNRYAVSPVLPLPHPGSAHGGKVFTNTWKIDIPYDGYYQLKGEVDDIARYYIDNDLKLDLSRRKNKIRGNSKFFLSAGLKTLRIEVENYSFITYKDVSKKIFSARDWRRQAPTAPPPSTGIICHAGGGKGGTDNQAQLQGGKVIVGKGGDGGNGGDDNWADKHHGGLGGGAGLRNGGSAKHGLTHTQIDQQEFTMFDGSAYRGGPGGFGVNFQGNQVGNIGQIFSRVERTGGNGVAMGGGGGGNCRGGSSGSGGSGGVQITWGFTGKSQQWTTPGIYNVTVPGNVGKAKKSSTVPITAKFEGTGRDDLHLVVSGTGTAECTIKLQTNDSWSSKGVALTAMKCGDINLARTKGKKSETLTGTGTFVGGRRYKVIIIGADSKAGPARVGDTRVELLDRHKDDTNASLNLSVSPQPQPMGGVTIVCIGGGGSGFMDSDGDRQGSGGSGGAYSWVNEDIEAGKQLKIVVGKGGQGKNVKGGSHGGDSYVEVISSPPANEMKIIKQQKGKVSYSGPNLFHYTDKRWGKVMNRFGVSPANVDADLDKSNSDNVGTKVLEWKNVDFPMKGQYDILFAADNKASLYINGEQLLYADENYTLGSDKSYDKINIGTPGRYDVKIELINSPSANSGSDVFRSNPAGVVLEIRKDVTVAVDKGKPWTENPVGVSGILVPPPCPKEVGGKGIVTEVIINDPGTGFEDEGPGDDDPQYPVVPVIKKVRPEKPGINYDCSKDKIIMNPDLGYKFKPVCDNFGRIIDVIVTPPPQLTPVPSVPEIWIDSGTGLGCPLIPEFDFPVVPPDILPPEDVIQVTDLAGIKQTGYYNGKPYYGAVFYEDGIKYAGWYATAGQPIQIYDTLQESIDATVTTPPSAIQRQGSDVTSNDPRLNIPGTPENLT